MYKLLVEIREVENLISDLSIVQTSIALYVTVEQKRNIMA